MKEGKQLHHRQQESAASTTTQLKEAKEAQPEHDSGFDARHPLYVGTWKRTVPDVDWTIAQDDLDEPQ